MYTTVSVVALDLPIIVYLIIAVAQAEEPCHFFRVLTTKITIEVRDKRRIGKT